MIKETQPWKANLICHYIKGYMKKVKWKGETSEDGICIQ